MVTLREADVRDLLGYVGDCFGLRDLDELRPAILPGLRQLVPCHIASYNESTSTPAR